jgi:hypothetical protein
MTAGNSGTIFSTWWLYANIKWTARDPCKRVNEVSKTRGRGRSFVPWSTWADGRTTLTSKSMHRVSTLLMCLVSFLEQNMSGDVQINTFNWPAFCYNHSRAYNACDPNTSLFKSEFLVRVSHFNLWWLELTCFRHGNISFWGREWKKRSHTIHHSQMLLHYASWQV